MKVILKVAMALCTLGFIASAALPAKATVIYDNGPDALIVDGDWIINNGGTVSNPFSLAGSYVLTDATASLRWFPSFPPLSVSWVISTDPSGVNAITAGTGPVSASGATQSLSDGRLQGYESFVLPNVALDPGSYWFTLMNAAVEAGASSFVSWGVSKPDVLDAFWNGSGEKPEESFQLSGFEATPVPEPSTVCLLALGIVLTGCFVRPRRKGDV